MSAELTITKNNFKQDVIESKLPVLLDFWADWCMPCKIVSPIVAEIANTYKDKIVVGKINVDQESELGTEYNIISIPTLMIIKDGKPVATRVGAISKRDLEALVNSFI